MIKQYSPFKTKFLNRYLSIKKKNTKQNAKIQEAYIYSSWKIIRLTDYIF